MTCATLVEMLAKFASENYDVPKPVRDARHLPTSQGPISSATTLIVTAFCVPPTLSHTDLHFLCLKSVRVTAHTIILAVRESFDSSSSNAKSAEHYTLLES